MSAFLGPIHYWLYNKIGNQEKLTAELAKLAEKKEWIKKAEDYTKELPELESVIDEGNIHGWLQGQIHDAEERYAQLVTDILKDGDHVEELEKVAYSFGKCNSIKGAADCQEAYRAFEDFFVNGMPCDHINQLTESNADCFAWRQLEDIHASYWTKRGNSSEIYYRLREKVMQGMLEDSGFSLEETGDGYRLTKKI